MDDPSSVRAPRALTLPRLGRRGMMIYAVIALPLFALALYTAINDFRTARWDGATYLPLLRAGVNYTRDSKPGLIVHEAAAAARRQGVLPGDRIITVDGMPADDGIAPLPAAPDGRHVKLGMVRAGRPVTAEIALATGNIDQMLRAAGFSLNILHQLSAALIAIGDLISLVAAALLFLRARSSPVGAMITVSALGFIVFTDALLPPAVANIAWLASLFIFYTGIIGFPDGTSRVPIGLIAMAINIVFVVLAAGSDTIAGHYQFYGFTNALAAVWLQLRRHSSPVARQQRHWAMIGFAGAAVCQAILLAIGQIEYVLNDLFAVVLIYVGGSLVNSAAWLCTLGGLIIALLRYRLYDADVVLTRATIWVIAAPILALIFAVITDVAKQVLLPLLGNTTVAAPVAGTLTALLIQPVNDAIRKRVERWARRDLNNLRSDLPAAIEDMRETDDRALLLNHICARVAPVVRAQGLAIVTRADGGWRRAAAEGIDDAALDAWLAATALDPAATAVQIDRADPVLPLRIPLVARVDGSPSALGWMLVGRRPDGSIQDAPAREVLGAIAPALGRALHVLNQRERRWQTMAARLAAA